MHSPQFDHSPLIQWAKNFEIQVQVTPTFETLINETIKATQWNLGQISFIQFRKIVLAAFRHQCTNYDAGMSILGQFWNRKESEAYEKARVLLKKKCATAFKNQYPKVDWIAEHCKARQLQRHWQRQNNGAYQQA